MPPLLIPVDQGLVTSKDASLLAKGELSRADDSEYLPNDPGLWKVPGRTAFNSAEASSIIGARFLEFDAATDLIVAHVGTTYRKATAGETGTFSSLTTGLTGGTSFDSVHYGNKHILMNGVDRNRVVLSDGTAILHGMLANTAVPTYDSTGVGTGLTLSSGATISYWVEERYKSGSTVVKRSSASSTILVTVTGAGALIKPVITRPTTVNSDATHWALFGSAANVSFPTGFEISEVAIATTTIEDTRTGTDPGAPTGSAYEVVQITLAGATLNVAKWGPPPIASTGDVLEDQVVMNDISDVTTIKFGFYDEFHAFPSTNVIRMTTKEADTVRFIRRLGGIIIVGLRDSMWRILTLPNPDDAAFQPGRVKEQIEGAQGIAGPLAGCLFSYGEGIRLAYVPPQGGVHITDGESWDDIGDDIDWATVLGSAGLTASATASLTNNPTKYRLEYDLTVADGTRKAYFLCYHPSHAKKGLGGGFRSKVTGPINRSSNATFMAVLSTGRKMFTCKSDGIIYLEGGAVTDASGVGNPSMSLLTGQVYVNGIGNEAALRNIWCHHSAGVDTQTAMFHGVSHSPGRNDQETNRVFSLERREATTVAPGMRGSAFQLGVTNSDTLGTFRTDYFAAAVEGQGDES